MVSIGTFSWDSLRNLRKFPLSTNIVMVATVVVVVFTHNLAYGVLVGVLLAALDKVVVKLRRDGAEVEVLGLNEASATIVDRFGVHDKPDAIDLLMGH